MPWRTLCMLARRRRPPPPPPRHRHPQTCRGPSPNHRIAKACTDPTPDPLPTRTHRWRRIERDYPASAGCLVNRLSFFIRAGCVGLCESLHVHISADMPHQHHQTTGREPAKAERFGKCSNYTPQVLRVWGSDLPGRYRQAMLSVGSGNATRKKVGEN